MIMIAELTGNGIKSERKRMAMWMNGQYEKSIEGMTDEQKQVAKEQMKEWEQGKVIVGFMLYANFINKDFKSAIAAKDPLQFKEIIRSYLPQPLHRIAFRMFRLAIAGKSIKLVDFYLREATYIYVQWLKKEELTHEYE